jgi:hypothetical protein
MLGRRDYLILDKLAEDGGFTTRHVARNAWTSCDRRGSAECRQALLYLQREGYVAPLDDQKPVAWVRTTKGTEALEKAIAQYDYVPYREPT